MNSILQVKLNFAKEQNNSQVGARELKTHAQVTSGTVEALIEGLRAVLRYYHAVPKLVNNILIDVNYNDIIAKSRRIQEILKPTGKSTNEMVVGARFSNAPAGQENHIITYYVDEEAINRTINDMTIAKRFIDQELGGKATRENFEDKGIKKSQYEKYGLSKSRLRGIIIDCSAVESFDVPSIATTPDRESFLVTFYRTELTLSLLLEKLAIEDRFYRYTFYGSDTLSVTRDLYDILMDKVPYMISMVSADFSEITLEDITTEGQKEQISIPDPANEPVIGVIDTFFDEHVYFSKWVENIDYLDEIERYSAKNAERVHGTQVTSLIVDGPRMNPWLDDGCGRFRVRHFGVCAERIQTAKLVRKVRQIVKENPDIHVWNLSLGTDEEVSRNFISYDAAALDELQFQNNVVFVIAGTNDNRADRPDVLRVGSPADSLNSIVVNSVKRNGQPASYARKGNILCFFNKPDVSYYGGDYDDRVNVYSGYGEEPVYGTSFAAPWISRKLCYLIDVMGLPREVAKALLIDAAAGWEYKQSTYQNKDIVGYGIVPIDIHKILSTENDEIRFVVYGSSESYRTVNYAIPVPRDEDNRYPYIARATLCYFPECSRMQGVDYTNRELTIAFGRITENGKIEDINDNVQDDDRTHVDERKSRIEFRKWENTKFISSILKDTLKPRKSYGDRLWGFTVTSKERLSTRMKHHLNFGTVITLKELKGINRIDDFVKACRLRGYIVTELDIQQRVDVYNATQEEIIFE
ncbi:MAG: S8 family peptidase [Clostridia bacterium]|nr:S8 family peptidase [Clostridia bacterium]